MGRVAILVMVAVAVTLGLIGSPAPRSVSRAVAAQDEPTPTPTAPPEALCEAEATPTWESADVRPPGPYDAGVYPAVTAATPTPEQQHRLYVVEIWLPPGHCMPYVAIGNQKEGAIVMIVQQGTVTFEWEPFGTGIPGAAPVIRGDQAGPGADPPPENQVPERTEQLLHPGDWVTLNQRVWFTYRNDGDDTAIILKAVWAVFDIGGCGGGCK